MGVSHIRSRAFGEYYNRQGGRKKQKYLSDHLGDRIISGLKGREKVLYQNHIDIGKRRKRKHNNCNREEVFVYRKQAGCFR